MNMMPIQRAARAIRAEYLDLPGLSLTPEQVQRLYSLDALISEAVLAALVDVEFLERNGAGRYVRAGQAAGARGGRSRPGRHAA